MQCCTVSSISRFLTGQVLLGLVCLKNCSRAVYVYSVHVSCYVVAGSVCLYDDIDGLEKWL